LDRAVAHGRGAGLREGLRHVCTSVIVVAVPEVLHTRASELTAPGASEAAADPRERVLSLLRRHGWNTTSFQVLEPDFRYWFDESGEHCVAYVDTGAAWVAAGAPLAPDHELARVADAFCRAAKQERRRALFFATEQRFLDHCPDFRSIPVGRQPSWNPAHWQDVLAGKRSLREQVRRARAKGVRIRRLQHDELAAHGPMRAHIERLIEEWLRMRRMAPMGFLVHVHPFDFMGERRLFVAEQGERVVGFCALVPIYARGGVFLEDLIRSQESPNGTIESLIDAAMRCAADEKHSYLTLGLAPLAGRVSFALRMARALGRTFYDFRGLYAFKSKLGPSAWSRVYVSHPKGTSAVLAVYDSLAAFARAGVLRFAFETLRRRAFGA
jgi:phosphatidylglycerol lysyltransferase